MAGVSFYPLKKSYAVDLNELANVRKVWYY
jgi:hypothetical protein